MMTGLDIEVKHLPDPKTGQALEPTPQNAVRVVRLAREMKRLMDSALGLATAVLIEESRRKGAKTLHIDGETVSLETKSETVWDVEKLSELLDLGLDSDRYNDLVVPIVSYKVDGAVARQIASTDERYAEVIEEAKTVVAGRTYPRFQ
jgi:hypothetical protein